MLSSQRAGSGPGVLLVLCLVSVLSLFSAVLSAGVSTIVQFRGEDISFLSPPVSG